MKTKLYLRYLIAVIMVVSLILFIFWQSVPIINMTAMVLITVGCTTVSHLLDDKDKALKKKEEDNNE
jgi:hypothetical protein